MYVCVGILALALAFHLGVKTAQSSVQTVAAFIHPTGYGTDTFWAITPDGDIFHTQDDWIRGGQPAVFIGNVFGPPVGVQPATWGQVKAGAGQ
jgi:hypothetical protein